MLATGMADALLLMRTARTVDPDDCADRRRVSAGLPLMKAVAATVP